MDKSKITQRAIAYLADSQEKDGSFVSYSSAQLTPFKPGKKYKTVFIPALILAALHDVPRTSRVRDKLCKWLMTQKNDQWSFNYWAKDSPEFSALPYPDDLDDTFCVLIALWRHDPALIEGSALGAIVRLLVATETAVGGPYRTWLVPPDSPEIWLDVDLAVNCNVAYFLRLVANPLPSLNALMDQAITTGDFTSPYYPTIYPTLYYMARAYPGDKRGELAEFIKTQATDGHWGTPLNTALAVSALKSLGEAPDPAAEDYLLRTQKADGSWPAEAFATESEYHGGAALTTALVLEALQPGRVLQANPAPRHEAQTDQLYVRIMSAAQEELSNLGPALAARSLAMLNAIQKADNIHEILLLPYLFAGTLKETPKQLPSDLYMHLGLANLYGWIAYTIYDDFLDDEGTPAQLPVATTALRYSLAHFHLALPKHAPYQAFVQRAFNVIDNANAWEVTNCRFMATGGRITLDPLPSYGALDRLAERSQGHILTPVGVLAANGLAPDSPASLAVQSALKHYIIARQLSDDAHDWQQDVAAGHISYVVTCILSDLKLTHGKRNLKALLPAMQRQFWHHTVTGVCERITEHTKAARRQARSSGLLAATNIITGLCDRLDASVSRTLSEQAKAKDFLTAYGQQRVP